MNQIETIIHACFTLRIFCYCVLGFVALALLFELWTMFRTGGKK